MNIDPQLVTIVKRLALLMIALSVVAGGGMLITYEVIGVEWLSTMEVQASFRPMEDPRPVPAGSVPIQGAAYVADAGTPLNPVAADQTSLTRGKQLYELNCALCHGASGQGDGSVSAKLKRKPANLTGTNVTGLADGDIFIIITNGVPGLMPALRENLAVGDRWDVVNYVRTLGR